MIGHFFMPLGMTLAAQSLPGWCMDRKRWGRQRRKWTFVWMSFPERVALLGESKMKNSAFGLCVAAIIGLSLGMPSTVIAANVDTLMNFASSH